MHTPIHICNCHKILLARGRFQPSAGRMYAHNAAYITKTDLSLEAGLADAYAMRQPLPVVEYGKWPGTYAT